MGQGAADQVRLLPRVDVLIRAFNGHDLDRRIRELHEAVPGLEDEFERYRERTTTAARLLRQGGDFPLARAQSQAAHEDVSKYFVDRAARLVSEGGAVGMVVPSVLYNGDGAVGLPEFLLEQGGGPAGLGGRSSTSPRPNVPCRA